MQFHKCYTREAYLALRKSEVFVQRAKLEHFIAAHNAANEAFSFPGYCRVHDHPVNFLVDRQFGAVQQDGIWIPNWRERLMCPECNMNNRQRAIAGSLIEQASRKFGPQARRKANIYLTEQLTHTYNNIKNRFQNFDVVGSEYLGRRFKSGDERDGVRHEDLESLSFETESMDFVLSSDALQLTPDPFKALEELCRVLRPDGQMFLSVPFDPSKETSTARAKLNHGEVEHLMPQQFHPTAIAPDGSLVYTNFGWDLLAMLREAGFAECALSAYWNFEYGHLGGAQFFFVALK
jgi:SAM-dependent methyltransferase